MMKLLIISIVLCLSAIVSAANEPAPVAEDVCQLIQNALLTNVEQGDSSTATQLDIIMGIVCPADVAPDDTEMGTLKHESALWCTGPAYHEPLCHSQQRQCCYYQNNNYPWNVYLRCKCIPDY